MTCGGPVGFCVERASQVILRSCVFALLCALPLLFEFPCEDYDNFSLRQT